MQARIALYMNDLRNALGFLQFELEAITIHWLRREELKFFIGMVDSQIRTKPLNFALEGLDVYLGILDYARLHPRYNAYRTRFGGELKKDLEATMNFVYMAGQCRNELMQLYNSGEEITDEAIEDIKKDLPAWESPAPE